MSDEIPALLERFESRIDTEEYESAAETLNEIAEAFAGTERENSRVYVQSLAASGRADDEETLTAFAESAATLDLRRSQFLLQAAVYLSAPANFEESTLRSRIDELEDAESTTVERRTAAESTVESVTLPPQPVIIDVEGPRRLSVGETATLDVVAANVGDESTASVTVTGSSGDGLTVEHGPQTIGRIQAGSDRPVEVSITGRTAGEYTLSIELAADGSVASTESVTVVVLESGDTDSTTDSPGDGRGDDGNSGLLPLVGGAGLGALGGGGALYRYLSKESESDAETDTNTGTDD
ncbi:hypothetical protein [Natrinema sp. CBA1119]|uniref:hypothetical protein n=1 Tax=Natrinema sp. CBA1119 TaxID=1608465 RepID=UPI00159BC321|nr:hypothetical protein [Natrinema sp. CBA1119]